MISKKLLAAIIATGTTASVLGISYMVKKKKKTKNTSSDDKWSVDAVIEPVDNDPIVEVVEKKKYHFDDPKESIYKLIDYLSKNGVDIDNVVKISRNVLTIYEDFNDIYNSEVRDYIDKIINNDYSEGMITNFNTTIKYIIAENIELYDNIVTYIDSFSNMELQYKIELTALAETIHMNYCGVDGEIDVYNVMRIVPRLAFDEYIFNTFFKDLINEYVEEDVLNEVKSRFEFSDNTNTEDNESLKDRLIKYLSDNHVNITTAHSIDILMMDIISEVPEEYPKFEILTTEFIEGEFSYTRLTEYFTSVYILLYTSMIPADIFVRYADKTNRMGEECQETLINLVEAIDSGINNNDINAIHAFAELYAFLKNTNESEFDESTYDKVFKPLVDKFVKTNDEVKEESIVDNSESETESKEETENFKEVE